MEPAGSLHGAQNEPVSAPESMTSHEATEPKFRGAPEAQSIPATPPFQAHSRQARRDRAQSNPAGSLHGAQNEPVSAPVIRSVRKAIAPENPGHPLSVPRTAILHEAFAPDIPETLEVRPKSERPADRLCPKSKKSSVSPCSLRARACAGGSLQASAPWPPTIIKMDVEGAEADAISGAAITIARRRPKMMIAAYHRNEDLFAIPLQILSICPDYRLFLRHSPCLPAWELNYIFLPS